MHERIHLTRGGDAPADAPLDGLPTDAIPYRRLERGAVVGEASYDWSAGLTRALAAQLLRAPEATLDAVGRGLWGFLRDTGWEARARLFEGLAPGEEALLTVCPDADELLHLPWEMCWADKHGVPIHEHDAALVRTERAGLPELPEPGRPETPGVLFAWSADAPEAAVEAQRGALKASCDAGGLVLRELDHADLSKLQAALDEGGFSVLHLLAHGEPGDADAPPALRLGQAQLTPRGLRRLLRGREGLRLLVLMACHSGAGDAASLRFGGLAEAAQEAGMPAVLASRWLLSQGASVRVTQALYRALAEEGRSLERALMAARSALLNTNKLADAFTLQLLARSEHLVLEADGSRARREVVATYPFGDSAQPTPRQAGERLRAELVLDMTLDALSEDAEAALLARLMARARDRALREEARLAGSVRLFVNISRDGLQRLFIDHRAGALSEHLGARVLRLQAWPGPIPTPPRGDNGGDGPVEPDPPPPPRWPWALGGLALLLVGGGVAWWATQPDPRPEPGELPAACVAEAEVCDGADNDCDGQVDEDATDARTFFVDADGDGVGGASTVRACATSPGQVSEGGDCDDRDAAVKPGAEELCDGVDDDCDGQVDEGATTLASWFADRDGDGYGGTATKQACTQPRGYVAVGGDCDDSSAYAHPGNSEEEDQDPRYEEGGDKLDNDCDGEVDEHVCAYGISNRDNDNYRGFPKSALNKACQAILDEYAAQGTQLDCDDATASTYPGAPELQDREDNDCDGAIDEGATTHGGQPSREVTLPKGRDLGRCLETTRATASLQPRTNARAKPTAETQEQCKADVQTAQGGGKVQIQERSTSGSTFTWTVAPSGPTPGRTCTCTP